MSAFLKILATVKTALEGSAVPKAPAAHDAQPVPVTPGAQHAELLSLFARELEALSARFAGAVSVEELAGRVVALADQAEALSVAVGEGVTIDLGAVANRLEQYGREVIRAGPAADDGARNALRERIARADLGVVEAHYAIAASGTLAVVATPARPNSLTLLPPAVLVIVRADRILPRVAAVIDALGAETFAGHRIVMISGPSRTADIEKRIVLGVHGPRELYVMVVWPHDV